MAEANCPICGAKITNRETENLDNAIILEATESCTDGCQLYAEEYKYCVLRVYAGLDAFVDRDYTHLPAEYDQRSLLLAQLMAETKRLWETEDGKAVAASLRSKNDVEDHLICADWCADNGFVLNEEGLRNEGKLDRALVQSMGLQNEQAAVGDPAPAG